MCLLYVNRNSPHELFESISQEQPSPFLGYTRMLEIPSQTSDFNYFKGFSCSPFSKEIFEYQKLITNSVFSHQQKKEVS